VQKLAQADTIKTAEFILLISVSIAFTVHTFYRILLATQLLLPYRLFVIPFKLIEKIIKAFNKQPCLSLSSAVILGV